MQLSVFNVIRFRPDSSETTLIYIDPREKTDVIRNRTITGYCSNLIDCG